MLSVFATLHGNYALGLDVARDSRNSYRAFENDMLAGMPINLLIDRYGNLTLPIRFNYPNGRQLVREDLLTLQRRHVYPYTHIIQNDDYEYIDFISLIGPSDPAQFGHPQFLEVRLKRPQHVDALRVECTVDKRRVSSLGDLTLQAVWGGSRPDDHDGNRQHRDLYFGITSGEKTSAVWINDTIEIVRIYPRPNLVDLNQTITKYNIFTVNSIKLLRLLPGGPSDRASHR